MHSSAQLLPGLLLAGCCSPSTLSQDDLDSLQAELLTEIDTLRTENAQLRDDLDALQTDVALNRTDLDSLDVVTILRVDTVWSVSSAAELEDAVAALSDYRIAADASLTIQAASGAYTMSGPLVLHHPDGDRIRLVGNLKNPAAVSLSFPAAAAGVVVDGSSALGFLGGLTLRGYGSAGDGTGTGEIGVLVRDNSAATLGPLVIDGFYGVGVYVNGSSFITVDAAYTGTAGWLTITDCDSGIYVSTGSTAILPYADVSDMISDGITASRASYIFANNAVSSDNGRQGLLVTGGSYVDAELLTANNNGSWGMSATYHSGLEASYTTIDSGAYGAFADWNSTIVAPRSNISVDSQPISASATSMIHIGYSTLAAASGSTYLQQSNAFIRAQNASSGAISATENDVTDFVDNP